MICTAPCLPQCTNEATCELWAKPAPQNDFKTSLLGYNCAAHKPQRTAKDYIFEPIASG